MWVKVDTSDKGTEYRNIKRYCFFCKKVTFFGWCGNCGRRFCLNHAETEEDGNWESGYTEYLAHKNCN